MQLLWLNVINVTVWGLKHMLNMKNLIKEQQ